MPSDLLPLDGCAVRVVDQERVAAARAELPPDDELAGLTQIFRLLGNVTRARLLYALLEARAGEDAEVVFAIDQLEELERRTSRSEAEAFLAQIRDALEAADTPLIDGSILG